jgi:hypothetical protein
VANRPSADVPAKLTREDVPPELQAALDELTAEELREVADWMDEGMPE